jgi:hypothetical protein
MSARSSQPEVRNPILALEAMAQLEALPPEARAALAAVLEGGGELAAAQGADGRLLYARHIARATKRGRPNPYAPAEVALPASARPFLQPALDVERRRLRRAMPAGPAKYAAMVRKGMA